MKLWNSGRVHIVITNERIRYSFHKAPSLESLVVNGEIQLPSDTIKDGIIEQPDIFGEIMKELVEKYKWKRKQLFFALPDDTTVIRQMEVPISLSSEEILPYIHTQIGNTLFLPFSNPVLAINSLEEKTETNQQVLLFAYPKEKIDQFIHAFERAKLKPRAADFTSLSIYRYYYQLIEPKKQHVLLIHWTNDSLFLTVFQKHKAIFSRYIKVKQSGDEYNSDHQTFMNDYITEISRIIDFYQYSISKGKHKIELLLLTGDIPYLPQVKDKLQQNIDLAIYSFDDQEIPNSSIDVFGLALKTV
ncbi:type IV pilus biogenesis protein PilM [Oceanobacillus sp. 1P07AA]|uniref:type IV pilus biogenesis protein PilM n=1 Tax=Oceanobacillus sp. 1P07AA TaxID=3132293 RepID=UPI0039A5168A